MKTIFKTCLFFIITAACIQQTVLALEGTPYYTCPSNMYYTPTLTLNKYCSRLKALCGESCTVTKQTCRSSYYEEFRKVKSEYNEGLCKKINRKFIEGTYNNAICTVDYVIRPKPQIMGVGVWDESGMKGADGEKCIDQLTRQLRAVYPYINDFEY